MTSQTKSPNAASAVSREAFVSEWCKDLRSGEYLQGKYKLSNSPATTGGQRSYCCLGVACLTGQRLGIEEAAWFDGENTPQSQQGFGSAVPGSWFYRLMGFGLGTEIPTHNGLVGLGSMNDELGFTFGQIANALEAAYLKDEEKSQ